MHIETVTLDTPIARGEQRIATLDIRKPNAGELRGVHLADLLQMDVAALIKVLPRLTQPTLTEQDVGAMDPADLTQCALTVSGFLLPRAAQALGSPDASKTPLPTSP